MLKQKRQAPRMPRKMKKRYKKLMSFYDERKMEFDVLKNLSVVLAAAFKEIQEGEPANDYIQASVIAKAAQFGIAPADIEKIDYNDKLQTATVTLKGAAHTLTMSLLVEEGADDDKC
jgi:hypothetical protein